MFHAFAQEFPEGSIHHDRHQRHRPDDQRAATVGSHPRTGCRHQCQRVDQQLADTSLVASAGEQIGYRGRPSRLPQQAAATPPGAHPYRRPPALGNLRPQPARNVDAQQQRTLRSRQRRPPVDDGVQPAFPRHRQYRRHQPRPDPR